LPRAKTMSNGLTKAQERFCFELCKPGIDQWIAYKKAFPQAKATDKTIKERASRLASKPEIKARIAEIYKETVQAPGIMELNEILLSMSAIARGDLRKAYEDNGAIKKPVDIDDYTAIALTEYDGDKGKIKMASKIEAMKVLVDFHTRANADPPDDPGALEEQNNAYDYARRIAFALSMGSRKPKLPEPST
jgi:hypothetical protein